VCVRACVRACVRGVNWVMCRYSEAWVPIHQIQVSWKYGAKHWPKNYTFGEWVLEYNISKIKYRKTLLKIWYFWRAHSSKTDCFWIPEVWHKYINICFHKIEIIYSRLCLLFCEIWLFPNAYVLNSALDNHYFSVYKLYCFRNFLTGYMLSCIPCVLV